MTEDFRREELRLLEETYRGAVPQLKFGSAFELLIAVILSAQCTDKRVNEVTQVLFAEANTPEKILQLGQTRLEEIIRPCGLSKSKAKRPWKLNSACNRLFHAKNGRTRITG